MISTCGGNAATWVVPAPREGIVPSGGQLGVVVTFDATGQFGGDYYASLLVKSDDPDESPVPVPVHLHVTGAPDIVLEGQQVSIESTKSYNRSGASTTHDLAVAVPPPADGSLELVAEGDYGDFGETATVSAEGVGLGSAGQVATDCQTAKASFPLSAALLSALTSDGVVHLQVQNSAIVDAFCPLNQHTVRLRYALPSDHLDFGPLFVGGNRQLSVVIRNAGTDVLHVTSIATNNPVFTIDQSSIDMPPNSADTVTLTFRPTSAQPYTGTLTITSDDPDEGVLTASLSGEGLLPPDIDVSPTTLHANLLTGGQQSNSVTIRNTGASDLTFDVEVSGPAAELIQPGPTGPLPTSFDPAVVATAGSATTDEPGPLVSAAAPAGYHAPMTPQSRMAGAKVLIVQDAAPWGTASNEQILNTMGVAFDMIPSSSLAGMSLSGYRLIIVSSDQPTNYYLTLGAQQAKLQSFVTAGGTLEVHAAGWGWQGGDASFMTIPGGMRINFYTASSNQVLAPAHPLMAGVPNPFFGGSASHAYFTQIPAGATAVVADDFGRTNLVVYTLGGGTVVAGCQTFEYGFANGQHAGLILQNMIPFSYRPGPAWLSADPTSGRLAPGASAILTVTFDATGLNGGDYAGVVNVRSNDPDESEVPIAASMHVTGAPDLLIVGRRDSVVSDQNFNTPSAVTTHHLAVVSPSAGDATLELDIDGDFGDPSESATVTVEGIRLGDVGRLGTDCTPGHGAFTILAADFANLIADGFLDVEVRNSFDVDLFCAIQHHRVTLHYPKPIDPIDFGALFVGRCASENLEVQNAGTDLLTISGLSVTGAGFTVTPSSMTLQPGEHRTVSLQFCPQTAQLLHGTLTITSDDPDEGVVTFALQGVGLVPPDIQVSPTAMSEQLLTGQTRTRSLTVQNLGGSDLEVALDIEGPGVAVTVETRPLSLKPGPVAVDQHGADAVVANAAAVLDEPGPIRSDQRPEGYRAAASPERTMAGATELLLQDSAPWGSMANETILNGRGIAYDMRNSSQLAGLNLSPYRLIIIPSDQPTAGYYQTVGVAASKLEAFVNGGGGSRSTPRVGLRGRKSPP
jgi:hypothetical protein